MWGAPGKNPFVLGRSSRCLGGRCGEAWHLGHKTACARPSLTFDQGMLVRGGGASQHPQLWPDLVDSLLLNLERDMEGGRLVGSGREAEAQRKEETRLESLGSWHIGWLLDRHAVPIPPSPHPSSHLLRPGPHTSPFSLRIL